MLEPLELKRLINLGVNMQYIEYILMHAVYWICSNVSDLLRICFFNVRSHLFYILSVFFSIYRPLSCHIITLYYYYLYFEFPLNFSHSHTLLSTHHRHTSSPVLFHPYPTHPFSYTLCTSPLYALFIFI